MCYTCIEAHCTNFTVEFCAFCYMVKTADPRVICTPCANRCAPTTYMPGEMGVYASRAQCTSTGGVFSGGGQIDKFLTGGA